MPKKRYSAEQIIGLMRQIEVECANGKSFAEACRTAGITENTCYRWRRQFGGMKVEEAKRLKELEKENARLKRVIADQALDNQILREVAKGKY